MIPKKIHWCWFGGGEKSPETLRLIEGWKRLLPDYDWKEWNESNFDVDAWPYAREALEAGKYAFVSDVARLHALTAEGGIYLDTDVELLGSFGPFLSDPAFLGFEARDSLSTAVMGFSEGHSVPRALLRSYRDRHFVLPDGSLDLTTNVAYLSAWFLGRGLRPNGRRQRVRDVEIYPEHYFSPNSLPQVFALPPLGAVTIHHFGGSWKDAHSRALPYRAAHYASGCLRNLIGTPRHMALRGG